MTDPDGTKTQKEVSDELARLRRRLAELEDSELKCRISEEALRKSEAKYKELVELLPQIVYEIDVQGNFTFVNCGGLAAFGYRSEDLAKGIKALDVVVPEDRERLARNLGQVMQGARMSGTDYTALRKDGFTFPIHVYSHPIVRDNSVIGIRGVCVDVSDLRRAQQKLWIKDSAIASSINAICLADLEGNLTYVNPAFLKLWEYDGIKEVLGKHHTELWHLAEKGEEVALALSTEGWWIGELVGKKKSGTLFDAHVSATMVTDAMGEPISLMGSFLDITDRKKLEEELRRSEERFHAVFQGAKDCIFIKDRSLRYTLVNPAVEKLVGLRASEIIGRTAEDIFGKETGEIIKEINLRVLQGQSIEQEQIRQVKGERLTFHDITAPLRSPNGTIVGVCTISRNVSERRNTTRVPRISVREYPSQAMRATLERARFAAARDSIILICGESGSGKDYVAQWIHNHSRRTSGPFFAINCAALPQELAESELFGHEPGAFTGARARKRGLLELAEAGTILLNEIGELPLALQSKLLTFLDTKSFVRVGGERSIHINARLIAATHRNLEEEVTAGRFLPALFYRLNVFSVNVPSLRNRIEDLPMLCEELMSAIALEMQLTEIPVIEPSVLRGLSRYLWPGNVRELRNVLERALMLWDKGRFELIIPMLAKGPQDWSHAVSFPRGRSLHQVTDEITELLCKEALHRCKGKRKEAAQILGISRNSLYRYMKRFSIEPEIGTDN
ncbi:MAG: sigma 54-interacting transcriptional regulator [Desulfomonile tiedjei]|uniref:Sigma 54-interacting transcriptional regulator n=1 Tax=Desulfomonile tiedjei TaxID=2358 RepID=A0A9D6Z791_9BACT|nr:sigma 54-interacting transcriptional regulator [Desulfomonile tiedjei]